ncbi:MAG: EF-hand domain-containing protein [Proteobacteria bacterium]|nr:EF-hand domain-containing protein [Pseudomonadota bacterium]MBU1451583.1 EF-hand domain-containing protein [Pseudomonadota bacterium]MBU2469071.1 EF-hand domain-containing protein [Pseudomonadota bacterium]MBU2519556.1 EF-hand domain-containing protein [Pseudomonadota bacterium]
MKRTVLLLVLTLALLLSAHVGLAGGEKIFMLIEKDGDGHITKEEIIAHFADKEQGPTAEEVEAFIAHNDKDKNGKISADEWKNRQQPPDKK